jgi:hypothetical protein
VNFADRLQSLVTPKLGVTHCDLAEAVLISAQPHSSPMYGIWTSIEDGSWRDARQAAAERAESYLLDQRFGRGPISHDLAVLGSWVDARAAVGDPAPGVELLAMADAIEGRFGHLFLEHFRARAKLAGADGLRVDPGRAVPRFPLIGVEDSHGVTTAPGKVDHPFDFTQRLKLAAVTPSPLDIRLCVPENTAVRALKRRLRIALIEPSTSLKKDFLLPLRPGPGQFFNVAPKDDAAFAAHMVRLYERARDGEATVVVFPELSLTPRSLDALAEAFVKKSGDVCILMPGSLHREVKGARVNEAPVFVRGHGLLFTQRKRQPYELNDRDLGVLREALSPMPPVQWVGVLPGLTFAVLVCRDGLSVQTHSTLAGLHLNLLAIPALSPKVNQFDLSASVLVAQAQGVVVVPVTPVEDGQPRGLALVPDATRPHRGWPPGVEDIWFLDATPPYDGR